MSFPVTRFSVEQVSEAPTTHALLPGRDWIAGLDLGAEGEFRDPLRIDLELIRTGEDVFVSGRVGGKLTLPCLRCLQPVAAPFSGSFRVTYMPAPADLSAGAGKGGEDEDVFYHENGAFDLLPMLREQLLVALPERALCSEACRGLCPTCGADLNDAGCGCPAQEGFSKFEKLRKLKIR
ncbi:MAG: DUF177 domain-containing protein [Myxococcota bacterium]